MKNIPKFIIIFIVTYYAYLCIPSTPYAAITYLQSYIFIRHINIYIL